MDPAWLVMLGFTLGICTGFFGIGGGFMVTPGFNMLGMPMPYAIGTDLMQMAGKSVISTLKHGKLGNVDVKLGIIMVVGTMAGVEAGKQVVMYLEGVGNVDSVVRYIYIAFLVGLGFYMLRESRKSMATRTDVVDARDVVQSPLVQRIRAINVPPFISFPVSGIDRMSIWVPIVIGFATGILAGLLGVGGGFIRMNLQTCQTCLSEPELELLIRVLRSELAARQRWLDISSAVRYRDSRPAIPSLSRQQEEFGHLVHLVHIYQRLRAIEKQIAAV